MHKYSDIAVRWFFTGFLAFFVVASIFFSGCSQAQEPKSSLGFTLPAIKPLPDLSFSGILFKGLQAADSNFHIAVVNGDLAQDDPIIPCFDSIVGTQNPNAQPYDTNGLFELASVAYIRLNSLQVKGGKVTTSCDALVGKFVRDAVRNAPINPARALTP